MKDRFAAERADNYDEGIRFVVPGYEAMHEMAWAMLHTGLATPDERGSEGGKARVLIAGSGTGEELLSLGARSPGWSFTASDPSPDMHTIARRRLADQDMTEGRVEFHEGYVSDLPDEEAYDAATMMLVLHFLPDDEDSDDDEGTKLALLRDISKRLKPGAPFVLADLHADKSSVAFSQVLEAWRTRQLARGMSREDADKVSRDVRENLYLVPELRLHDLLTEAGFTEIVRFYNAFLFGGWRVRKKRSD